MAHAAGYREINGSFIRPNPGTPEQIARRGVHLILVARRPEPLELTAERLRRAHGVEVRTVAADLAGRS
jgi:short-subunit dehydrogenase